MAALRQSLRYGLAFHQPFVPEPGAIYEATAKLRLSNPRNGVGVAVVFQYSDAQGERLGWNAGRESLSRDEKTDGLKFPI